MNLIKSHRLEKLDIENKRTMIGYRKRTKELADVYTRRKRIFYEGSNKRSTKGWR
ncbi:hypothetical protein CDIMF43_10004 [Carnobacterium divergens]|nr:hypothetical protein CDIMF43_10004 [Carnobacterium divergens]